MASLRATTSSADVLATPVSETGPGSNGQMQNGHSVMAREGGTDGQASQNPEVGDAEDGKLLRVQMDAQESAIDDSDDIEEGSSDLLMSDPEAGPSQGGKRVKVYELRETSWHDRGTGFCKGIYDDSQDLALLIVESEFPPDQATEDEGEGGFLKEELLLSARVEREDIYSRQQDTLIVWTEPATNLDIALSFQDADCCQDIWDFICEVQRHLNTLPSELEGRPVPSSSSPLSGSPMMPGRTLDETRLTWEAPSLANVKSQEMWLRMQAKSVQGREKAVEHIIGEDYIKHLIVVFDQAEDLESLDDLHALCSLMQTILLLNDNTIFEYVLQDDIFLGVIGMLEYDPDFPTLKASYRQFYKDTARYREVVEIRDPVIRTKIHQTYRLLYLKDVVLARVLDDPTFGILNGFVFFNQVDIINYINADESLLLDLFSGFREPSEPAADSSAPLDERKRDVLLFLHQLMLMGKGVQMPNRLNLYRNLVDKGILYVCEWALRRHEAQMLHAGAEILTLAVEHDAHMVRLHILREQKASRRTLVADIIAMLGVTKNLGLLSQMIDVIRTLLDVGPDTEAFSIRGKEPPPTVDAFFSYFYDNAVQSLYQPLLEMEDVKPGSSIRLPREKALLFSGLIELFSFSISNTTQAARAAFFLLSNVVSRKITSLLYVKDKPLRHAVLRYIRTCLKTPNHFIHRNFSKLDLLRPLVDLMEEGSGRDNMISSSYTEILELIRKENIKAIINYLFETYRPRLEALSGRPFLRATIQGLFQRWEANNEPPPPPPSIEAESSRSGAWSMAADEDSYFQGSDDEEELGPKPPTSISPQKRKRNPPSAGPTPPTPPLRRPAAPSPGKMASGGPIMTGVLGLDYDDNSDSEGSSSPTMKPQQKSGTPPKELEEGLGDVAVKMRQKRLKAQQDDDELGDLFVGRGAKRSAAAASSPAKKENGPNGRQEGRGDAGEAEEASPGGSVGKRIKLSLGAFGKRVSSSDSGGNVK